MHQLIEKPRLIAQDHYLLRIHTDMPPAAPGQFVSVKATENLDPLLRRPFSVFDHQGRELSLVVRVVGKGTRLLGGAAVGPLDLLGPLGTGFSLPRGKKLLLAGGGVGNAPLHYLGKKLKEAGNHITYLYGARSRDLVYCREEYARFSDEFIVVTDDGSAGRRGLVADEIPGILARESYDRVFCCGPVRMMEAVARNAGEVPVEISVENYFGCGIGLCMGCTLDTALGQRRACVDGPVFDGSIIRWETMRAR